MKNKFTLLLKSSSLIALFILAISFQTANAQEEDKFSFDVSLNSDQFFGFYPFFQ
ncbi:DUF6733 family protein, partial [Cecembia rubra]